MLNISPSSSSASRSSRQPRIDRPVRAIRTDFLPPPFTILVSYAYKRKKALRLGLKSVSDLGANLEFRRTSMRFCLRTASNTIFCASPTTFVSFIPICFATLANAKRPPNLCSSIQHSVSIASSHAALNNSILFCRWN